MKPTDWTWELANAALDANLADTESDGFHGRLLSIGLVTQSGESFHGVLPLMDAWAIRRVVPALGPPSHFYDIALAGDLAGWLCQFEAAEVIADWHLDLVHFFRLLGPTPGQHFASNRSRKNSDSCAFTTRSPAIPR